MLFVLKERLVLSFVPIKFKSGLVPVFPASNHASAIKLDGGAHSGVVPLDVRI